MTDVRPRTSQHISTTHTMISGELAFRSYFQQSSVKLNLSSEVISNIFFFLHNSLVGENDMKGNDQNRWRRHFDNTISTLTFLFLKLSITTATIITGSLDYSLLKATFVSIVLILRLLTKLLKPIVWSATWAMRKFSKLKSELENLNCLLFLVSVVYFSDNLGEKSLSLSVNEVSHNIFNASKNVFCSGHISGVNDSRTFYHQVMNR